jgi:hypothetical protein
LFEEIRQQSLYEGTTLPLGSGLRKIIKRRDWNGSENI